MRSETGISRPALAGRVALGPLSARALLVVSLALLALASGAQDARRNGLEARAQAFWRQAQEDLFAGVTLSADQRVGVDAIIAEAARDRARAVELRKIVRAPGEGDSDAKQRARADLRTLAVELHPQRRIEAMRELLDEEQRALFDRNWRLRSDRLFAEEKRTRRRAAEPSRRRADSKEPPR